MKKLSIPETESQITQLSSLIRHIQSCIDTEPNEEYESDLMKLERHLDSLLEYKHYLDNVYDACNRMNRTLEMSEKICSEWTPSCNS